MDSENVVEQIHRRKRCKAEARRKSGLEVKERPVYTESVWGGLGGLRLVAGGAS